MTLREYCVIAVLLLLEVGSVSGQASEFCTFRKGECVYNIRLEHKQEQCAPARRGKISYTGSLANDQLQRDYADKIKNLERFMKSAKSDHEARLKLLERVVSTLGIDVSKVSGDSNEEKKLGEKLAISPERSETQLLTEIHDEFSVLRQRLNTKTDLLLITERRLNDTLRRLSGIQVSLLRTNKLLVGTEDERSSLKEDNFILKTQLKEKVFDLGEASGKLDVALTDLKKTRTNFTELQSMYKKTLAVGETYKNNLDASVLLMTKAYRRNEVLLKKFIKTRSELSRREKELLECYTAKTATYCGFENSDICGFTQENNTDFFNWTRAKGGTPSGKTGPARDHTCASRGGYFMYIEASSRGKGQNAILYSPRYRGLSQQCLEFYYHMYGYHIGTLNVYTRVYANELSAVWRAYGNQGNFWILARLHVPEYLARAGYQLAFEGITADGYQGDIAIDDVSVRDGMCPQDEKVKPVIVDVKLPPRQNVTTVTKEEKEERRRKRKLRRMKNKLLAKIRRKDVP